MTIKEFYEWAVINGAEDYDISVRDWDGSYTNYIEPEIIEDIKEVEL